MILEQISELIPEIKYLVNLKWYSCDWEETDDTVYLRVYKPKKGESLQSILDAARLKAKREVEREVNF